MKLSYRPEIDGLRAIAVCAVILYHAKITILGLPTFKGGFIGVDVFFVISGYLITSIILKESIATGSFSLRHFYERRIRRIIPALLFVMLISLPFAWIYLLPDDLVDYSKSILYSLGFISNFYFYSSGEQYGALSGFLKPFLHTWSLSVEEQFYIIYPIFLILTIKYFKKYLIHILVLGIIISMCLAEWTSRNYPSFSFYVLPTRVWELLSGAVLAYFEIIKGHRSKDRTLNSILPAVGFFLIIFSILFFNDKIFYPSFLTLFPVIGACLIIWFSNKNELTTKILSTKLFVGIGLISYSLYLWHYPIFAFGRYADFFSGSTLNKLIIGLTLLLLSTISYYFIEQSARKKKYKFKIVFVCIIISYFALIIINSNIILNNGYKHRLPKILVENLTTVPQFLLKNFDGKICYKNLKVNERCEFNTSSKRKVYLIGDSHMASLMFNLKDRIVQKDYQFIVSVYGGCLYYPGFNLVEVKTKKISSICNNNYFTSLKNTLSNETNSIIIFGGRFPVNLSNYFFDNKEGGVEDGKWKSKYTPIEQYDDIRNSFKNEVLELSKKNKIILIYPIPEVGVNPNRKIYLQFVNKRKKISKDTVLKNFLLKDINTSFEVYLSRTKSSFELLDSIKNNNVYRVYPHTLFCNSRVKNRCVTHDDKDIFYTDSNHPSLKGSEMINTLIMKELLNIELN